MSVDRTQLPAALYTAEQSRALDRYASERAGIPGFKLMQRAGRAAFQVLQARWPECRSLSLICGGGNNGGDGFIMAGLALQQGLTVQLLCLGEADFATRLRGEALEAWRWLEALGLPAEYYQPETELRGELIVDAILGTGLGGPVRGMAAAAIEQLNRSGKPVLAVDIPSGLCADTGAVQGVAVKADCTVTFIGVKQGLLTHEAVDHVGQLYFDALLVPDEVYEQVPVNAFRTAEEDLRELLPARRRSAHKGAFGHVLVVGGDHGFGGAALMAAQAAARCGAGLTSLATREAHVAAALLRCPEVMAHAVRGGQDLAPLLERASVVVVGPGLGQSAWGEQLLRSALDSGKPLVLDADALNLLAQNGWQDAPAASRWILTPHPGEAARLLDCSVAALQSDRFAAVLRLQRRCGGIQLLKGAGSLVTDGDATYLCSAGNPGMASGGMGDVLAGIIGALRAQGLRAVDAARLGVYLHACAADRVAAAQGERGMLATDLIGWLPPLCNGKI